MISRVKPLPINEGDSSEIKVLFLTSFRVETFPECSLPSGVSKNTLKMVGYVARLRDVTGQSYPIFTTALSVFLAIKISFETFLN